jgi:hypothetical protein
MSGEVSLSSVHRLLSTSKLPAATVEKVRPRNDSTLSTRVRSSTSLRTIRTLSPAGSSSAPSPSSLSPNRSLMTTSTYPSSASPRPYPTCPFPVSRYRLPARPCVLDTTCRRLGQTPARHHLGTRQRTRTAIRIIGIRAPSALAAGRTMGTGRIPKPRRRGVTGRGWRPSR